ncbi:MAG: PadR family transcriptional regulator [Tepidiformaceae bacterium]
MRRKADTLLPIELSILRAGMALRQAGEAEFHGYAVAKEITELGEARRLTAHGTLYRALDRLEQRKLLESRLEDADLAAAERRPRRRLYTVTALGERAAQAALPERAASASTKRGLAIQ